MAGKSIEAILSLNITQFETGLNSAKSAVNNFKNSLMRWDKDSAKIESGIDQIRNSISQLIPYLNRFKNLTTQTTSFKQFATGLKNMATAVKELSDVTNTSQVGMIRIKQIIEQWSNAVRNLQVSVKGEIATEQQQVGTLNRLRNAYQSLYMQDQFAIHMENQKSTATKRSINDINQYVSATNRASSSTQRLATSNRSAVSSTNQLASATSRLGKAMSSLRMMGTMVGSMLAYNFAHNLMMATNETIQSKSEMEGYFKMLHFGQGEIQKFNNALDDTVKRFQRVNKYSLGETISSIGVEFDLSTDEMIKAMDVTSMITSEYLRAGRNANEASLAVKDVLQGQFQRLSRETGVKGEQLKDAGWNGDVTDVNSLLDALRKVAEDRNWDVFAEKANSLNDVVTILQNRFGEWSADMVNTVQPSIVNAFNSIMMVGGALANILGGVWEWLNGDGLVETATRWTLIASAITTVTTALISYRTGANLVQIVQMGLRGSLMATVFGLKAEEVALYGSRNALISKLTSLKAEQVAEMGVRRAIMTKVLGLNAEMVANNGLKGAIMSTVLARKLEEAETEGATIVQKAKIVSDHMEEVSNMSTLKTIIAKVAGVNMETFAQEGLIVALAQRIAQSPLYIGSLKAEEVAELSTAQAGMVLMTSILPLVAVFVALAVAVYSVVKPLQDASAEMKDFNNIVQNGKNIVESHRKTYNSLSKSYEEGNAELGKLTKGTAEYTRKQKELEAIHKDVETAQKNVNNSYKAYQMAVSSQTKFEEESAKIRIHSQTQLEDAYIKAGMSAQKASELASNELDQAKKGAEQLREALQMLQFEADKSDKKNASIINMLDQYGLSDEQIEKYGTNLSEAQRKILEGTEKFMTSEDWMERIGGWFEIQQGRLEEWWTEFNAFFEVRDWAGMGQKLWDGLENLIDWRFPDLLDSLKSIGDKGLVNIIRDTLFGEGDADGTVDIAYQFLNDAIATPIAKWIDWFKKDPVKNLKGIADELSLALGKFLFGKDSDSVSNITTKWFADNVEKPISDWITGFINDPLSYIGNAVMTGVDWFGDFFSNLLFGEGTFDTEEAISKFTEALSSIDLGKMISDFFSGENSGMHQINVMSILQGLLGLGDSVDFSWVWEWLNNNIIVPIQTQWNMFLADPLSYIGGLATTFGLGGLLSALMPNDGGASILNWVNTSIIQPLALGIQTGIASIPIVSDIAQMLGLIPQQNPNAQDKGTQLMRALGNAVTTTIGQIPILGDILRMLGLIPQANGTANANGRGVGQNISSGTQGGMGNLGQLVLAEFNDALSGIGKLGQQAYNTARNWANQLWEGVNSILQRHSPGFFHDQFKAEFGTDIPNAIESSGETAYATAQSYAQNIKQGIADAGTTTIGMDGMVTDYQTDAQIISDSSQMMGMTTTTAFNDMALSVNSTTSQMQGNVVSSYNSMNTSQTNLLNNMKQKNTSAYNDMYLKSNQSLTQMRDSTSNITHQMTNAWNTMKNNIVESANRLKHDSTVHFNTLSNTIGSFYRKIQNPSSWGAGSPTSSKARTSRKPTIGRRVGNALHGAGSSGGNYRGSSTMSISQLKKVLCPNGDCGNIFDGYAITDRVNVQEFINSIDGEHGFGGWSGWNNTHYSYIKNKSDQWGMKSPTINLAGGIPTNANYKVGDFENGSPKISFGAFQSMAESIFSAIPYRHYYDSSWKGSWLGALQAGACNCSDGADALIAFAGACGFGGHKVHGTWDGEGHFWAVINGKPMDTTAWQKGYGWTSPKVHGYGMPVTRTAVPHDSPSNSSQPVVNVTITFNEPVYGVDELNSQISNSVDDALAKHFNKSYSIGV